MTVQDLFIAALLILGGTKAARAASTSPTTKQKKAADALDRISGLQARANQPAALAWIPELVKAGASPELAAMLARWIGIESSGNPSKPSSAGEYGLLQILPSTAKEALTPGEWLQLKDPTTSRADQAKIALKQYRWHVANAKKWVKNWPGGADETFYAKMSHARPADLSSEKPDGAAAPAARIMIKKSTTDADKLLRLAAAAVVRWGNGGSPMKGSRDSLSKAVLRAGDFHLRRDDRQMFANYVEMSAQGGTEALRNVRRSAMVVETPVYDSARLWQINVQFGGPRAVPPVPLSPWVPALASAFGVRVTLRAALDRDKATPTVVETLTPLDFLLLGNGIAAFQQRFQAGVQVGVSVELTGPGDAVVGVQVSIVEVEAGERDGYADAVVNGNGTPAGQPFPQTTATQIFLLPNALRRQFVVQNWGNAPLFIQFGQGANGPAGGPPSWTVGLPNRGDIYESPRDCWLGYVTGIWSAASAAATDFAMVTEGT